MKKGEGREKRSPICNWRVSCSEYCRSCSTTSPTISCVIKCGNITEQGFSHGFGPNLPFWRHKSRSCQLGHQGWTSWIWYLNLFDLSLRGIWRYRGIELRYCGWRWIESSLNLCCVEWGAIAGSNRHEVPVDPKGELALLFGKRARRVLLSPITLFTNSAFYLINIRVFHRAENFLGLQPSLLILSHYWLFITCGVIHSSKAGVTLYLPNCLFVTE